MDMFIEIFKSIFKLLAMTWYAWVFLFLIAAFAVWLRSPKRKGKAGEKAVIKALSSLPADKYFLLNDIMLNNNGTTSQIDHVLVSVYGIFVIETKNYQGRIYGSERAYNWTQNIYGNKSSFKNPIHQNYGHIKALESCLSKYGELPFISVVCFSDNADLRVETEKNAVINRKQLLKKVESMSGEEIIPEDIVNKIVDAIIKSNITDKDARKKHVDDARTKKNDKEEKVNNGICPRCGSNLVMRHGRNGDFIGCSGYPKCRYTESI